MSAFLSYRGARIATWIGLGAAFTAVAPAACLFPDYAFDERPTSGAGAGNAGGGGTSATGGDSCQSDQSGCVPEVPEGWTGYFALYDGEPADDPGCPAQFPSTTQPPLVSNRDIDAPPAVCTCSCGPAERQACARLDTISISSSDAPCGESTSCAFDLPAPANWTGSCTGRNGAPGRATCGPEAADDCSSTTTGDPCVVSVTVSALEATGGQCVPNTVRTEKPELRWKGLGRACAADSPSRGACNIGQVCLPKPSAPFESGACITQEGDLTCPPGAYTAKHVFFTDVVDARDCTNTCTCSAPSGGTCATTVTLFSDTTIDTCSTQVASVAAGSCTALTGNPNVAGRRATPPAAPSGGTCSPSGGSPTGKARGDKPRTFCCVP